MDKSRLQHLRFYLTSVRHTSPRCTTTHPDRFVFAARLVDAILKARSRMELNDPFLAGDERSFKGARAASRDIFPENRTIVLNIRDL